MARLTDKDRERILADWKAGYSQNQLAKNYQCSPATINKLCKGIEQENVEIVNTKVAITREMQEKSEYEVNAIHKAVDEKTRHITLINRIQEKALGKADAMLDQIDTPSDLKTIVEAVDKASITLKVSDRHAKNVTAIQINDDKGREIKSGVGELYKRMNGKEDEAT